MTIRTRLAALLSTLAARAKAIPGLLKDRKKRWQVILPAVLLLAAIAGLTYYSVSKASAQKATQATLQTSVARRGEIILSASGTGTLAPASEISLGFGSTGKLTKLNVKVGDKVEAGQVLAELDNTSQKIKYEQAKLTLAGETSVSAIATAQQAMAQATLDLQNAELQLEYLISPPVYYWEQEIVKDEQALQEAQAAADAAPSDKEAQAKLQKAKDVLAYAKDKLIGAQASYEKTYVPNNFTVQRRSTITHQMYKFVSPPSAADILSARAAVTIAQGALTDAQNLYAALTGGEVPENASGSGLLALQQARLDLQSAEDELKATQVFAPFAGTVMSVDAQLGDTLSSSAIIGLADLNKLYLKTYVDESDYSKFKVGNEAQIVFDALPDQTFQGKVVQVNPALDTSSGSSVVSGLVELEPTSADLLMGMSASVDIIAGQAQNTVLVPIDALHEYTPGKYAVFVMQNGKLTVRYVEVGLKDLVNAEIKSGLQPGDIVSTGLTETKQ